MYLIAGRRRSPRAAAPDAEATPLSGDDGQLDGGDEQLDEADLDDPGLLGELDALRLEMGLASPDQPADDASEVEVTEEDMQNPVLLAELSRISGGQSGSAAEPVASAEPMPIGPAAPIEPAPIEPAPAAVDHGLLHVLSERQAALKQAALAAKRQGQMARARELLVRMKEAHAAAEAVRSGRTLPRGFVLPEVPAEAGERPAAAAPPKPQPVGLQPAVPQPAVPPGEQVTASSLPGLRERLARQAAEATRLAEHFYRAGDKQAALGFHRLKKQAAAGLGALEACEAGGARPRAVYREVRWAEPVAQRRDIGAGQLQVAIGRVFSDGDLAATLGGRADFYLHWQLAWPRDKSARGSTRTIGFREFDGAGGTADAGYVHAVDMIDRLNTRPLQRWADRARLSVELYKYMGLLWGSQLVGRGALPLAALRTQSEAAATVEIKAAAAADSLARPGRPLPGGPVFVDVAARIRLPLSNAAEVAERSERWVQIPSVDEIAARLDAMDGVVSNAALELELQQLPARIAAAGADQDAAAQLRDVEAAIKLRMSVVAAQVGAGALTVEAYMAAVAGEAGEARQWALAAKRAGRKDLAVRALRRAKAMQAELDEMAAAMAAGDE
ncbi:hypothetical protein H4R18_004145 [Coemansia javaensis]|uniref:DM14 domain-containing protein n=1 Tax=Coemansia javaensis TaxID=2761396 RepID=A0A9W8LF95_9FUNG|nr:hypothetical protein H4R18_004145 [Coemansia javaensis]